MFRLWYLTFFGEQRESHAEAASHHDVHESPWSMLAPLVLLAVLSLTGGWIGWPQALGGSDHFAHYLDPVFHVEPPTYEQVSIAMATGRTGARSRSTACGFARRCANGTRAERCCASGGAVGMVPCRHRLQATARRSRERRCATGGVYGLLKNKYAIDELYSAIIVQPLTAFHASCYGAVWKNALWMALAALLRNLHRGGGQLVRRVQSGNIRSYAGWLALGAAALLIVVIYLERF